MTNWRPTSGPRVAARRAALLRRLRNSFDEQSVLEIDTPALSATAASDVQIESLEVRSSLHSVPLYLHTSPEFCMKRLLAAGYPDIYSICRVFRDGESGAGHQPEFTMLEWYRLGFDLEAIVENTLDIISVALNDSQLRATASILNYRETFTRIAGVDPVNAPISDLADAAAADDALRSSIGDERDDWLDLLLTLKIAPSFAPDRLTVLQHYPASQAALARICPADASVADRFEVFAGKLELANGYVELTDAEMQSVRFTADQSARQRRSHARRPLDESFLAALRSGLPACAGVAIGIERLQMILENTDDIRKVVAFPFEGRNE